MDHRIAGYSRFIALAQMRKGLGAHDELGTILLDVPHDGSENLERFQSVFLGLNPDFLIDREALRGAEGNPSLGDAQQTDRLAAVITVGFPSDGGESMRRKTSLAAALSAPETHNDLQEAFQ